MMKILICYLFLATLSIMAAAYLNYEVCAKDNSTAAASPFSIRIIGSGKDKGLLEIRGLTAEEIAIHTRLTCDLCPGAVINRYLVSKDKTYRTLFLNVTEQKYVPLVKDYKGKADLFISYTYKDKFFRERLVWDIFIPKESLGKPEIIYAQDGTQTIWINISGFHAVKTRHEIERFETSQP